MNKYMVTFTQYNDYEVEAHNEDAAFDKAYEEFRVDMSRPIARTWYDNIEVECTRYGDDEEDEQW